MNKTTRKSFTVEWCAQRTILVNSLAGCATHSSSKGWRESVSSEYSIYAVICGGHPMASTALCSSQTSLGPIHCSPERRKNWLVWAEPERRPWIPVHTTPSHIPTALQFALRQWKGKKRAHLERASQMPPMKTAQNKFSMGAKGSVTLRRIAESLKYTKNPTTAYKRGHKKGKNWTPRRFRHALYLNLISSCRSLPL